MAASGTMLARYGAGGVSWRRRLSGGVSGSNDTAANSPRSRVQTPKNRADAVTRQTAEDEKQARLAAALRENLKRRKAQARARRSDEAQAREPEPPSQADTSRT